MLIWVLSENPNRYFYEALGGRFIREKEIEIGGTKLKESAYGWKLNRSGHIEIKAKEPDD
ncbi:hypothetical protein [Paenibacillus humicola]|uniref:hypothetical protein n=1 Tax=Paenibacillus humicola TaxID=3110540 RepID=UPI00237A3270|nr:hypothetical protein [Paenibacillus humicola]